MKNSETFVDNTAQIFLVFCLFGFLFQVVLMLLFYEMTSFSVENKVLAGWDILLYGFLSLILDALGAFWRRGC